MITKSIASLIFFWALDANLIQNWTDFESHWKMLNKITGRTWILFQLSWLLEELEKYSLQTIIKLLKEIFFIIFTARIVSVHMRWKSGKAHRKWFCLLQIRSVQEIVSLLLLICTLFRIQTSLHLAPRQERQRLVWQVCCLV